MVESKKSILPRVSFWLGLLSLLLLVTPFAIILSLSAIICGLISKKDTKEQRSYSLIGMIIGFVVFPFVFLMFCFTAALWKELTIECEANMKNIGVAFQSYSTDYNGEYPPYYGAKGMNLLWKQGYIKDSNVFICPSTLTRPVRKDAELTESNLSYVYRPPSKDKTIDPYDIPIVWDKPGAHRSLKSGCLFDAYMKLYFPKKTKDDYIMEKKIICTNVLYKDGHIGHFFEETWQKEFRIIKTNEEKASKHGNKSYVSPPTSNEIEQPQKNQ